MKFTYNVAFASFLAKATFSVVARIETLHLDKSCKMIKAYRRGGDGVDITLLT